jgi:glutamate-1-semialdehyde aminotransferase
MLRCDSKAANRLRLLAAELNRFLYRALGEGVILVQMDACTCLAAHSERDVEDTRASFARVFATL